MNAHVLLNLLYELRKRDKMWASPSIFDSFFAITFIHSSIQKHECYILFFTWHLKYF